MKHFILLIAFILLFTNCNNNDDCSPTVITTNEIWNLTNFKGGFVRYNLDYTTNSDNTVITIEDSATLTLTIDLLSGSEMVLNDNYFGDGFLYTFSR